MDIKNFNFSDLSVHLHSFDKEIFEKFQGKDDLDDYFLGEPFTFDVSWKAYEKYYDEDIEDYTISEEKFIEMEKDKRLKQFSEIYPGIEFEAGEAGWGDEFYIAAKNLDAFLLYSRAENVGSKMLDTFRDKNINENLLVKSIYDQTIPISERNNLIPLLSRRKGKYFDKHLENIALDHESTESRHIALGSLYSSVKDIDEKTLDYLLEEFPGFTLSSNLSFIFCLL